MIRRNPATLIILTICLVAAQACTADEPPLTTSPTPETESQPMSSPPASIYENPTRGRQVVLQIPGMHEADVTADLPYAQADGRDLLLDLYRPASSSGALPVVVLGGPPAFDAGKESGQKIGWGQLIAASGMAAAVFDIRSDRFQATPQDPSTDVAAAISYLRSHADELRIDPERLCSFGFSIGTAPWHLWATMRDPQPYVRCNVVYYGPLDFQGGDFSIDPALADEYSALTYLRRDGAGIAPMFIAKAGQDRFLGITRSIDRFGVLAQELDAPVTIMEHAEGEHAFDLGLPSERTIAIMKATLDFLRASLGVD